MSFLTPLYILGALAVAGPILFHLIRRSPRGEVPFSSLMFLVPTPPRLTRRSRLDQIWLLVLRASALCLLALAFARPFVRQAAQLDFGTVERQRIAVLLDTSASMRRGDLWPRAKAVAEQVIGACGPSDQVAVFAFDRTARPLLGFDEAAAVDPARRQALVHARLEQAAPTWASTRLDQALIDTVGAVEDVADTSEKAGRMPRKIVLVSDLQQGSRLEALGDFEWPSDVALELKTVTDNRSNAGVQRLGDTPGAEPADGDDGVRVRVANDAASRQESFQMRWVDAAGKDREKPVAVYVPPGESRVVRVPRPPAADVPLHLRLDGDQQPFDNALYLVTDVPTELTVLYVGRDQADDPAGLAYYLRRVFTGTARAAVRVASVSPGTALTSKGDVPPPALGLAGRTVRLVVLSTDTTPENERALAAYLERGGTLLYVLEGPGQPSTLAALAKRPPLPIGESDGRRDALLAQIAFDHPLFAPLAGAQFNDFTKVRFWKHRRLPADALADAKVLARFDDGDPAVVEKPIGKGRLFVLTSGWNPDDSQLARSSKFVPLMMGLLEAGSRRPVTAPSYHVLERVPLPSATAQAIVVRKPDGSVAKQNAGRDFFEDTDRPGVYTVEAPEGTMSFAVNLDPAESQTAPLHVETLEQFGCRLASASGRKGDVEHFRQLHNAELEGRQKLWRWLIVAAVVVLIVETWLAGRVRHPRAEALAT